MGEKKPPTISGFFNLKGIYQVLRANYVEYLWKFKFTDPNTKRNYVWQNQSNLFTHCKCSINVVLSYKFGSKKNLNPMDIH